MLASPGDMPPALKRTLRERHVSMIAVGGIIGAGLFVGSSASIAAAGPAVIVSYVMAGALILLVMRMLAEMSTAFPGVGSFTEYARLGLGHWAGFTSGWLYWYFWAIVVAIETVAGSALIAQWLPLPRWIIGGSLLALMTTINMASTRSYGEFEFWFASLKVGAIVVFIVVALSYSLGITSPTGPTLSNLYTRGGFMPLGFTPVLASVTSVIFALCGAEIATVAAAETADPEKTVVRLTLSVAIRIALFYVISIALIVCVVPWNEIKPGFSPFTTALSQMHIPAAGTVMNLVVLVAVLSCMNSGLYVSSRVLFVLSAAGDAPYRLVALSRRGVPARAVLVGSTFGFVSVAASFLSPQVVFAFLVNASGAVMLITYLIVSFAHIRLRRRVDRDNPPRPIVRMWLFPWLSYAAIVAMVAVLGAMAVLPEHVAELYASLVLLAAVSLVYAVRKRRIL